MSFLCSINVFFFSLARQVAELQAITECEAQKLLSHHQIELISTVAKLWQSIVWLIPARFNVWFIKIRTTHYM